MLRLIAITALAFLLTACGGSPGALQGTWKATNGMPLTTTFRDGEMESMGLIEKVEYKVEGNSVIVTMKDGLAKGSAVRFTLVDASTVRAMGVTYRKVGT